MLIPSERCSTFSVISNMKILYISYYYPPNNVIASLRSLYNVKYLRELGAEVSVICFDSNSNELHFSDATEEDFFVSSTPTLSSLKEQALNNKVASKLNSHNLDKNSESKVNSKTPKFSVGQILASKPIEFIANCYRLFHHTVFFFNATIKGLSLCNAKHFDYIYASYGPPNTLYVGWILHRLFNVQLITEFRDRWYNHPHYFDEKPYLSKIWIKTLEELIVSSSSTVIGVSPSMIEDLRRDHPFANLELVYNGYDEALKTKKDNQGFSIPKGKLTIAYTGTVYERHDLSMI